MGGTSTNRTETFTASTRDSGGSSSTSNTLSWDEAQRGAWSSGGSKFESVTNLSGSDSLSVTSGVSALVSSKSNSSVESELTTSTKGPIAEKTTYRSHDNSGSTYRSSHTVADGGGAVGGSFSASASSSGGTASEWVKTVEGIPGPTVETKIEGSSRSSQVQESGGYSDTERGRKQAGSWTATSTETGYERDHRDYHEQQNVPSSQWFEDSDKSSTLNTSTTETSGSYSNDASSSKAESSWSHSWGSESGDARISWHGDGQWKDSTSERGGSGKASTGSGSLTIKSAVLLPDPDYDPYDPDDVPSYAYKVVSSGGNLPGYPYSLPGTPSKPTNDGGVKPGTHSPEVVEIRRMPDVLAQQGVLSGGIGNPSSKAAIERQYGIGTALVGGNEDLQRAAGTFGRTARGCLRRD